MLLSEFNSDEYVAHYTSLDTAVSYIIPTKTIKVGSSELLNDPYENVVDWLDMQANVIEITSKEKHQNFLDLHKIKDILKRNIKIFSTTTFDKNSKNIADVSNHIYCRPRMWAQYGDNHKGVCLIFSKKELHTEFKSSRKVGLLYGKIEYENFIPIIHNDIFIEPSMVKSLLRDPYKLYEKLNDNQQLKSRFFKKHTDWKSEHEYRWLLFSENGSEFYLPFHNSLKAIVFGSKTNDRYFKTLKDDKIPLYFLQFTNGNYQVLEV